MIIKIKKILSSKRGDILGFIIISPFILYIMLYLILGGAYLMKINDMSTIANKKLDRALVYGQFNEQLSAEMLLELEEKGFKSSDLEIDITPSEAYDSNDSTYATRGNEIQVTIIYKRPHWFYYVNKFVMPSLDEKNFYIGTKISGMSELW